MTSVITSWLSSVDSGDHSLLDPPTPQADAYFRQQQYRLRSEGIKQWPPADKPGHERHDSFSSYSNEDSEEEGKTNQSYSSDGSDWSNALYSIGQWTSKAAIVVATTITSTTKQIAATLDTTSAESQGSYRAIHEAKVKIQSVVPNAAGVEKASCAEGIDRSYLRNSEYHRDCRHRSIGHSFGRERKLD